MVRVGETRWAVRAVTYALLAAALTACGSDGGGSSTTGPTSSGGGTTAEPKNYEILSEGLVPLSSLAPNSGCAVRVVVRNKTSSIVLGLLGYVVFDSAGNQIGISNPLQSFTLAGGETKTLDLIILPAAGGRLSCGQIARFQRVAASG
jgi:hypothetical protein